MRNAIIRIYTLIPILIIIYVQKILSTFLATLSIIKFKNHNIICSLSYFSQYFDYKFIENIFTAFI